MPRWALDFDAINLGHDPGEPNAIIIPKIDQIQTKVSNIMSAVESDELWMLNVRETTGLLPSSEISVAVTTTTPSTSASESEDIPHRTRTAQSIVKCVAIVAVLVTVAVLAPDWFGTGGKSDDVEPTPAELSMDGDLWWEYEEEAAADDSPIILGRPRLPPPHDYTEEALRDKIVGLPGLDVDLGFNMFAGYLTVSEDNGRNIFYWYVESQNDPATDPVVFWTNGGPGCSGLIGFGQEHGPFHFSQDGVVSLNPYSWNTVANMLYVEIPAGVGFSYSDIPEDTVDVGDEETAADNLIVVEEFFKRFPARLGNDFFISSESYGGHYIPQLAKKIIERMGTPGFHIRFKGFLVGNPWVDPFTNDVAQVRSFFQHGLISLPMMNDWLSKCSDRATYDHNKCPKGIRQMRKNMKNVSPYALDYPVCTENKINFDDAASSQVLHFLNRTATKDQYPRSNDLPRFLPPDAKYLPCAEQHFKVWLNQKVVQEALHVNTNGDSGPMRWHACAPSKDLSYRDEDFLQSQIPIFRELIALAKHSGLHLSLLVFSGDNDSVCSTSSTQAWIYDLGVDPLPFQDWDEWSMERQTAGFITRFDLGKKSRSKFSFATIHGAGHEAAAYRPIEALELFRRYLSGDL